MVEQSIAGDPRGVFLTGATGFFGAFLLRELLDTCARSVTCLVRAADEAQARDRVRHNLARYHRWDPALQDRITVTVGDLAAPRLGLSEDAFQRLADDVDVVIHNGATVNHLLPVTHLQAANVDGTRSVVELAATGTPKPLHFVSANAVAEGHDTGYAETKRQAEKLVRDAAASGATASIYRLPRLAPDSRTGLANENDITIRLLDIVLQVGAAPDIAFTEIWVAADVAAGAIIRATAAARSGATYSLGSRERVSMQYLVEIAREAGFGITLEPLEDWTSRVRALGSSGYDVTLGVLGLDATDVADPGARPAGHDERYGALVEAPAVARDALLRYFTHRRDGF